MVTKNKGGQPLVSRLWGSGFLPSRLQGVRFRAGQDPVLYLRNPAGIDSGSKKRMFGALRELHELQIEENSDPQIETRIAQHELAFRMQTSIPQATDLSDEPEHIFKLYGEDSRKPGTFAANCLLARRFAERGVRFIQLYHQGYICRQLSACSTVCRARCAVHPTLSSGLGPAWQFTVAVAQAVS